MQPTPHDTRLSDEALAWVVRLNRLHGSEAEVQALAGWCARSAAHARAWREALALWQLLLPAACQTRPLPVPRFPSIARAANDIHVSARRPGSRAAFDPAVSPFAPFRSRSSWS